MLFSKKISGFHQINTGNIGLQALRRKLRWMAGPILLSLCVFAASRATAADKFTTIFSSRVMSQSMPWMAEEAGLFKKYNLDFHLVFISSSGIVAAALLGGDADMTLTGGIGNVVAYVRGTTDIVFVGVVKNVMTPSLVAGGAIKRPEHLKGKKIAVSRIGGSTHY